MGYYTFIFTLCATLLRGTAFTDSPDFSQDPNMELPHLVDIHKINPKIRIDLRYGTIFNPLWQQFYPNSTTIYVENYVAVRLSRIQKELEKKGFGLVIYEGYRPPSIQTALEKVRCEMGETKFRFDDTPHYRKGVGVDVAIYYLEAQELELPTAWGIDCERAYVDALDLPAHVYHNRTILTDIMIRHGFVPLRERWWHFDLKDWKSTPDLPFEYSDIECRL